MELLPAGSSPEIVSLDDLADDVGAAERGRARRSLAAVQMAVAGSFRVDGAITMCSWLVHHARMSRPEAARLLVEGRFLHRFDAVADAAMSGLLSAAQIALLRQAVTTPTASIFADQQDGVVAALVGLDLHNSVVTVGRWREQAEAIADMPEPKVTDRSLTLSELDDGTCVARIVLQPGAAAQLRQALDTARTWDGDHDVRSRQQQNADALDAVVSFFNANHERPGTPRHRPHLSLNMNVGDLERRRRAGPCATTQDGRLVPSWTTDALTCDCVVHRVLRAPGTVLEYGRATRSVPAGLYAAVIERDRCCRFCDRPAAWCDVHHVTEWWHGGDTALRNLLLLCSHHHRMIHRDRWCVELHDDGAVTFTHPDGHAIHRQPRQHHTNGPPVAA